MIVGDNLVKHRAMYPANGDDLTVRCVGGQITIWLNDVLVSTVTETQGLTATRVGLQASGTLGLAKFRAIAALPA